MNDVGAVRPGPLTPKQWFGIAVLALIAILVWQVRYQYHEKRAAEDALTVYKAQAAQAAADAMAENERKRKAAEANNAAIITDLQGKLSGAAASSTDLANRLRLALASLHSCPTTEAGHQPPVATAPGVPDSAAEAQRLTSAIADYDSACQRDAARYNALIGEITPQL
jgi:hypothetical protein